MPESSSGDARQVEAATEYARRATARKIDAERLDRRSALVANLRLLSVAVTIAMGWLAFKSHLFPAALVALPVVAFFALVTWHDRVLHDERCALQGEAYWRRGLARIEDRWRGAGATGMRYADPEHVYAGDLDLLGNDSLFQHLSTARTQVGEGKLASWLLAPASPQQIRARQAAVAELRDKLDLREDLATAGADVEAAHDIDALLRWAESPLLLDFPELRIVAPVVAAICIGLLVWVFAQGPLWPFLSLTVIEGVVVWRLRLRTEQVIESVSGAAADLRLASHLLARIERESFSSARLKELSGELRRAGKAPSQVIAHLAKLADYADSRHNWLLQLLNVPLLYTVQVALAIEAWRKHYGKLVRGWLEALAEVEALASLGAYAYEHPEDAFPELAEAATPVFEGAEIGHPLLAAAQCVRNSVRLGDKTQVLLVSGSNMSGKSTLLRAVGISVVMAMAGAPVRARRLRVSPLQLGTCIRVTDSLQQGKSGFYAEITRLRRIMDLTRDDAPLMFLCDELLHGTNSHDRRIGAEGIVRAFMARQAIGIVTTHDLALTAITQDGRVSNAHFEDQIADRQMHFDYRLREGVVTKSNALELMRSVGLEV